MSFISLSVALSRFLDIMRQIYSRPHMKFKSAALILFTSIVSLTPICSAESGKYPIGWFDRRAEEIGSILGGDKVVFGRSIKGSTSASKQTNKEEQGNESKKQINKEQINNATKKTCTKCGQSHKKVADYFWQATLDSLRSVPIVASDSAGGVISTDWYEDVKDSDTRYKLNILVGATEVKVSAFKQLYKDNRWRDDREGVEKVSADMLDKIISRAHTLQAQDKTS
jgi:hypothetical protein